MLATHIEWENNQAEQRGEELPSVVHYKCPPDITFEEFGTVYRVLRRMHVESDSVMAHSAALQYFGPFDRSEMLVDYAIASPHQTAQPPGSSTETDLDVICCETEARTDVVVAGKVSAS